MIRLSHWLLAVLALVSLMASRPGHAVEVPGLYQAVVPVDSREDARQRTRAMATGMREMLIRLTGHDDVLQQQEIQQALTSPQTYVESWVYQTRPDPRTQEQHLTIEISFFPAGVQQLLNSAGVGLWPQNRPQTLAWILLRDDTGTQQYVVNPAAGTGVADWQAVQTVAATRGLPLVLPKWDFEDQTTLLTESLQALDVEAIRTASGRYGFDSVLAISADKLPTGHFSGRGLHLFREHMQEIEVSDASVNDFFTAMLSMVTRELADNYAVRVTSRAARANGDGQLLLRVDGVHGLDDYASVLRYVGSLEGIVDLQVREVNADTLTFSLNASGQVRQLVENLALDHKLQPAGEQSLTGGVAQLHYRWQSR